MTYLCTNFDFDLLEKIKTECNKIHFDLEFQSNIALRIDRKTQEFQDKPLTQSNKDEVLSRHLQCVLGLVSH